MNVMQPVGIWDHYIVYDEKVGNDEFYIIHLYDIRNGSDQTIATGNVRSQGCIGGEADNGKVGLIFGDVYRIMLYDINSGVMEQIVCGSNLPYKSPCLAGQHLLYVNSEGIQGSSFANIYDYDMVSGRAYIIMPAPDPNDARLSGSDVVWWFRSGDIRRVALARNDMDGGVSVISAADIVSDHPRISGHTIVYHCTVNGTGYVNVYNVDTRHTERLIANGSQSSCDIYGDRIVYDDNRDGNWNIYMTDRATGQETRLTNEPHDQSSPLIWGDYVAYFDNRNGSQDIYVLTMGA
jgi:beta propeller repeat protein